MKTYDPWTVYPPSYPTPARVKPDAEQHRAAEILLKHSISREARDIVKAKFMETANDR